MPARRRRATQRQRVCRRGFCRRSSPGSCEILCGLSNRWVCGFCPTESGFILTGAGRDGRRADDDLAAELVAASATARRSGETEQRASATAISSASTHGLTPVARPDVVPGELSSDSIDTVRCGRHFGSKLTDAANRRLDVLPLF